MIRLYREFIHLLLYPISSRVFLGIGFLLLLFVSTARVESINGQSFFYLGSAPIPAGFIESGFGLDFLLALLIILIASSFGTMTLNSHLVHIVLPRVKNRFLYLTCVYLAITTLIALGISGLLVLYLRGGTGISLSFMAWISSVLSMSFFAYAVLFFMNFRSSSKQAALLVILFCFILPMIFFLIKPIIGARNVFGIYFTDILYYLDVLLTPFKSLSRFSTEIFSKKPLDFEPLLKALPGLVVIISGSYLWFTKKDIH
jgi:hypothetical protein